MKYHLVRKNLTYMIGPLNEAKLRAYLQSSDAEQNDEISGSCGKWVRFGDTVRLKKYYPGIHHFLESRSKNWDMSIHSAKPIKSEKGHSDSSWRKFLIPIFALVFSAAAICFVWAYQDVLLNGVVIPDQDPYSVAVKKYNANRFQSLFHDIDRELASWKEMEVDDLLKRQGLWLPIIRSAVYASSGLESRYQSILPDAVDLPLVGSCSRSGIQTMLESENLAEIFENPFASASSIARMLLWDPQWVKRRKESGWGKPQNRYEACLVRLKQVLEKSKPSPEINQVLGRVNGVLGVVESPFARKSPSKFKSKQNVPSFWSTLSCLEAAPDKAELIGCSLDGFEEEQKKYLSWRVEMRLIWLDAMQRKKIKDHKAFLAKMQTLPVLPHVYQPELKVLQVLSSGSSLEEALRAAEALDEYFRL